MLFRTLIISERKLIEVCQVKNALDRMPKDYRLDVDYYVEHRGAFKSRAPLICKTSICYYRALHQISHNQTNPAGSNPRAPGWLQTANFLPRFRCTIPSTPYQILNAPFRILFRNPQLPTIQITWLDVLLLKIFSSRPFIPRHFVRCSKLAGQQLEPND